MKVEQGKYFGGEALTWSVVEKVYKDIFCGKFSFLEPIKDQKNLYDNHKTIFSILANVHKVISTKNASQEQLNFGATECERFGMLFPMLFS